MEALASIVMFVVIVSVCVILDSLGKYIMTKIRGDKVKKQKKRLKKRKATYEKKSNVWYCLNCNKNMGNKEFCPFCGEHRLGDMQMSEEEAEMILKEFFGKKAKQNKQIPPIFSEEECFLYGIHPDDEMYRKVMELNILTKNYDE
ncbi:MAG: hypothetical protein IJA34_04820 [Lachnospiraceae bacterium]|nr:hypothetical protein [Lachnospiraceae bacterium]